MGRARVTLGIAMVALAIASPGAGAGSDDVPKSAAAKAALREYDEKIAAARQTYTRDAEAAWKVAAAALGGAMKSATQAADLDEANRIKATIEALAGGGDVQVGGEPLGARAGKSPKGTWEATFLNGNRHLFEFDGRGGVRTSLEGRVWKGKVRREGRDLVCKFDGEDAVERFSFAGDRIFVEYFRPADRYPRESATDIATGLPARPGRAGK